MMSLNMVKMTLPNFMSYQGTPVSPTFSPYDSLPKGWDLIGSVQLQPSPNTRRGAWWASSITVYMYTTETPGGACNMVIKCHLNRYRSGKYRGDVLIEAGKTEVRTVTGNIPPLPATTDKIWNIDAVMRKASELITRAT